MQRLIDANALIPMMKYATTDSEIGVFPIKIGFNAIIEVINNAPTIDAEPVRHGKWIKADSQQYFRKHYPLFTCSVCGYRKDSQKKWNYCPNCGADMRGENDD